MNSTQWLLSISLVLAAVISLSAQPKSWDTSPDTWVATDALGRAVSTHEAVGPPKSDKFVGIFYFLWMGQHGTDGPYDVTKILAEHPDAMKTPTSPPWGPMHKMHHWGEPLFGYYLSDDAWVLRKHAQMLADAGVDVVIFDVTNQTTYQKVYMKLCEVFSDVRRNGGRTPQIAFLTPFWDPPKVVKELYENLYKPGLYSDLWFRWKGKPLILADPAKSPPETKDFFTFRKPEPSYFVGPSGPNQWGWLEAHPQHVFYDENNKPEQMVVGIGQNAHDGRLSAFSVANTYGRSWHNGKKDERPGAVNLGLNVTEQWKRALEVDPEFIFITGWNKWIAMRFDEFAGEREPVMLVDQFTQEYSRDIEPMKGGHSDSYYYQMVDYIRKFKGARKPPAAGPKKTITIGEGFADWKDVTPEFRDETGDTAHRDHPGYDDVGRYVNETGRNDFVLLKVARDDKNVYFYARTKDPITPHTDPRWMMLFINADGDCKTGWEGYDFVVNRTIKDASTTLLEVSTGGPSTGLRTGWNWKPKSEIRYCVKGNELELAIPRKALGFGDLEKPLRFDFKWADNMQQDGDILEFTVNGDAAPNGRFSYRFVENG
ncbi:MAG: hypothetical protein NTU88_08260 [Armatimonadetes bacterium]|nr:hypothetical protein [Armatimonadota bacterium]